MSEPFVGEIRMFGGNFAPAGWAFCDGQLMPISENEVLFQLIGTTYGGDGESTFAMPNLQSRLPMHAGTGASGTTYQLGEQAGVESVTLTANQTPTHTHQMLSSSNIAQDTNPMGKVVGQTGGGTLLYIQDNPDTNMFAQTVTSIGGNQPHENLQPYLCVNFIISLFGIFPTQT